MITKFDIQEIYKQTWGYVGLPFPEIVADRIVAKKGSYRGDTYAFSKPYEKMQQSRNEVAFYAKNSVGNDIYMPIWLYTTEKAMIEEKYLLPNTVMSMTCNKNIVVTPLVNRNGTVKEEVSIGDWEINVRGVMVSPDTKYPETQVQLLNNWYNESTSLFIENARTAILLGENPKVLIVDLKFPEIKGFENTQPYEIKLISDTEFNLYV